MAQNCSKVGAEKCAKINKQKKTLNNKRATSKLCVEVPLQHSVKRRSVRAVSVSDIPIAKAADPPVLIQLTAQSAHVSKVPACR